jgi:hypothetical protein
MAGEGDEVRYRNLLWDLGQPAVSPDATANHPHTTHVGAVAVRSTRTWSLALFVARSQGTNGPNV